MNKSEQKLFWIILAVSFILILFIGSSFLIKPTVIEIFSTQNEALSPKIIENKTASVILTGDIMLDRGVDYMVEKHGNGDFKFPFLKIADYLKTADIVFGNLEGIISDKGFKAGSIYSFRVRPEAIDGLKFAGFNVLSIANNHAFDYTKTALEDCLNRLNNAQISYVGAGFTEKEAFSPVIKEVNGIKIAFLAYTNFGTENWRASGENSGIARILENDFEIIKEDIKNAKSQTDILIVSLHAGEEYTQELTDFQVKFSKMAIEAGADIIAGHHPHIVQKQEQYALTNSEKIGWIFYSLGNFIFDQSFSKETMEGEIIKILIENKKIKEVSPMKIKINEFFQPEIAND